MKVLRLNNDNVDVKYLKHRLRNLGYATDNSYKFDSNFEKIVADYQLSNNIYPDGIVGRRTWESLNINKDIDFIRGEAKYIFIHCTATPEGRNVQYSDVYKWHTVDNGWSDIAYAVLIGLHDTWYTRNENKAKPNLEFYDPFILNSERTFGVLGHNNDAIDICYVGGIDANLKTKDTLTVYQFETLKKELFKFILHHPTVLIGGHNQVSTKDCPSFNVANKLRDMGIPERNILK